jgi:hypothetical protein
MQKIAVTILSGLMLASLGATATTQPSTPDAAASDDPSTLEFRANDAFTRRQYAVALPLFQKLTVVDQGQADKVAQIQEEIRVCQKNIDLAKAAMAQQTPGVDPTMEAATRTPHPAPKPGETLTMTIKELGNFEYDADKGGNIPKDVQALTGVTIRLNGFMIPMDQAESITQFALVPSLFACCFGQPPQIQHTIIVNCPKGKSVSYCPDEISVEGKLTVDEKKEDGFIVSIFDVECSSVKPMAK